MHNGKCRRSRRLGRGILTTLTLTLLLALTACYTKVIRDDSVDAKINRSLGGNGAFNDMNNTSNQNISGH